MNVPPEQVWDYLGAPRNMMEWWPDCEGICDVTRSDDGAIRFKWTDCPAGVVCHGEITETVLEAEKRLRLCLKGDLCGELRWQVQRENGGSRLIFESDYDLPVRALIPHLSAVRILTFQQDEADAVIRKVRERFCQNFD